MKSRWKICLPACASLLAATVFCFASETNNVAAAADKHAPSGNPTNWARRIEMPGVKNCFQVTTNLFRGAQPTAEGMTNLKALGIKTVINLRTFHSDKDEVAGTGLKNVRFETKPWHGEEEDVVGFLKVVADTNNLPALVHCQRGADRTGLMCAMYRITVCGWTKEQALAEMKDGGFGFSPTWKNLVTFVEKANIEDIKHRAGLSGKQKSEAR